MAYILTNGKTYTDKSGVEHATAYAAIDDIINCKRKKEANIILKIFASKDSANSGKEPFEVLSKICNDYKNEETVCTDWSDYLSPQAVSADNNSFERAYVYFNEKQISIGGFNISDWESDE